MRKFFILALLCSYALSALSQNGTWSGELSIQGTKLPLVFHFSKDGCTMDSPKQGAKGIPTQWTPINTGKVLITIPAIGAVYEGQANGTVIRGMFKQGGMSLPLDLSIAEEQSIQRPQTPKAPFPYETQEVEFRNGDVKLHGTLSLPQGYDKTTPVVLLITGSGQQNRDEAIFDHKPFAVIADAFARQGIATLRYDDRFYGDTTTVFSSSTITDFYQDALAGIQLLRERFTQVGALGHSEGGAIALLLASNANVDFVVSMAGAVVSGRETLLAQNRGLLTKAGLSAAVVDIYCQVLENAFDRIAKNQSLENIPIPNNLPVALQTNLRAAFRQLSTPYMRSMILLDVRPSLTNIHCPVLALNGMKDTQVDYTTNLSAIEEGIINPEPIIVPLENLNHLFQHCQTGEVAEYEQIAETISTEVLQRMVNWVKEH